MGEVSRSLTWLCIGMVGEAIVIGCQEKDIVVRKKEYLIARMLAVSILVQESYKSFDPLPAEGNAIETYDKQKTLENNSQQSFQGRKSKGLENLICVKLYSAKIRFICKFV